MKLTVLKKQLPEPPETFLRHAGYAYLQSWEGGQDSFVRRLTRDFYPRFHLYFSLEKDARTGEETVVFNLHLDQKKPGYAGFSRHNGEYDGPVVEAEAARLKSLLPPDFFSAL